MVKYESKFKKHFVKDGVCQRCGFSWSKHLDKHKQYCIAIVKYELDRK